LVALAAGGTAVDAVVEAVRSLEDDPLFNAGVGSVLTRDGTVEVDAAVMEGAGLRFGGIAAMGDGFPGVAIARAVLEDGEHVLLCGEGAWAFARERGFGPRPLETPRAKRKWVEEAERRRAGSGSGSGSDPDSRGTVGAVCVDERGDVAAATSTGGTTFKRAGRIGDTPICGAGTYADGDAGAASATGQGEAIIRVTMTRYCVDVMRSGRSAGEAARAAVAELARVGGNGGIICCDARGMLGAAHDTAAMPHAAGLLDGGRFRIVTHAACADDLDLWSSLLAAAAAPP
jgi:beta-aspartyl-peptidase (threonine type)